jgi:hypothetical protein
MILQPKWFVAQLAVCRTTILAAIYAVTTPAKILNGTIPSRWYRSRCCNDSKDFDGTILAADIAADAVTTAKILDGTFPPIAIAAIANYSKIADAERNDSKIADVNVTKQRECRCYECKIR